jgi:hypothetical protein
MIFLDQVRFEYQCVCFCRDDDRLEVGDVAHQMLRLEAEGMVAREVAAHARPQPLGLADVQDDSVSALPEIHSGAIRKMLQLLRYIFGNRHHRKLYA